MSYNLAVFGSAENTDAASDEKAKKIGQCLAKEGCVVITGACPGLPYAAATAACDNGGSVWGFSPAHNLDEHKKFYPKQNTAIYSKLLYVPESYQFSSDTVACKKYRNISSTLTCNAAIIISGRWGTLNEITNLFDMGKIIGVLTGSGGIADELERLSKKFNKKTNSIVVYDSSPENLVEKIVYELKKRNQPEYEYARKTT